MLMVARHQQKCPRLGPRLPVVVMITRNTILPSAGDRTGHRLRVTSENHKEVPGWYHLAGMPRAGEIGHVASARAIIVMLISTDRPGRFYQRISVTSQHVIFNYEGGHEQRLSQEGVMI